jgi:hypothetical protein
MEANMTFKLVATAVVFAVASAMSAQADELVIKDNAPSVTIKERAQTPNIVVKDRVTTGIAEDCKTKSVTKTDADGDASKTVTKTKCD